MTPQTPFPADGRGHTPGLGQGVMYEIAEHYGFAAIHEIQGLSVTQPCTGVHLHQWSVEVVLLATRLTSTDGPSELVALEPLRR